MAQLLEYIKMAVDNIRSNKGRSFLTMLGIIIGISSVILIVSIGNGASAKINSELEGMTGNQMILYVGDGGANNENYITEEDVERIKNEVDNLAAVTPKCSASGTAYVQKGEFDVEISAGTEDMQVVNKKEILRGKYFSESDVVAAHKVGIISQEDALRLFGTDDVVGMEVEVTLEYQTSIITIIGVTTTDDSTLFSYDYEGMPVAIDMPYTTLESIVGYEVSPFYMLSLKGELAENSSEIITDVTTLLKSRHRITDDNVFLIQDYNDMTKQITQVLSIITTFVVFVAGISLLVGGIGVMNIMLVSVTERTREIGIRKALGAKTKSIMLQFLAESAIITLCGGIIGILLGILGAYGICEIPMVKAQGLQPLLTASTIIIATVFSSAVGIFFGIYPARKAAKMSPIEALRRE